MLFQGWEDMLIDPNRRSGDSISRFLDIEDVSVTKMIEMMRDFLFGLVRGHDDAAHGLNGLTSQ